jgi:hypothetical protein
VDDATAGAEDLHAIVAHDLGVEEVDVGLRGSRAVRDGDLHAVNVFEHERLLSG